MPEPKGISTAQIEALKLVATYGETGDGYGEAWTHSRQINQRNGDLDFRNFNSILDALERRGLIRDGSITEPGRDVLMATGAYGKHADACPYRPGDLPSKCRCGGWANAWNEASRKAWAEKEPR